MRRPTFDWLEDRCCPALTILIDYSLDTLNFFYLQERRDLLQRAADTVAGMVSDSLAPISVSPGNTWTATLTHPATLADHTYVDRTIPADTFLLFAGGTTDLDGSLAQGGPGGYHAVGSRAFLDLVGARGQRGALGPAAQRTDFGPWGGSISFSTSQSWYFDTDDGGLRNGQTDFFSTALHELMHAVGFGAADSWDNRRSGSTFAGPLAVTAYDLSGNPPITADGHWASGTTDGGREAALDPSLLEGTRKLLTGLDRAALGDLGWQLVQDNDATLATATETNVGTSLRSFFGQNRSLESRLDVDLYRFRATAGAGVNLIVTAANGNPAPYLRVFTDGGTEVAVGTSEGATPATSRLVFQPAFTGIYYVGISSSPNHRYLSTEAFAQSMAGDSTGSYNLTISLDPEVRFRVASETHGEDRGTTTVFLDLSFASSRNVTVPFVVSGTALGGGSDYSLATIPVVIAAGQTSASLPISIVDDVRDEIDETVILTLGTPTNAFVGTPASQMLTLIDDDASLFPPTALDDTFVVSSVTAASVATESVVSNDTDPDGTPLSSTRTADATLGTVTLPASGLFHYTPGAGFWGIDSFRYQASDGTHTSNTATVTLLTHNALQVRKLYNQILHRGPDGGGWEFWSRALNQGAASLGTLASGIFESPERLNPIITQYYRDYLLREPDGSGLAFWRGVWIRDGGPENVVAGMISSNEFFASAGGTNRQWVAELYRRLLGREADSPGLDFWTAHLDSERLSRVQVVLSFVTSDENFRVLIRGWYLQYLARAVTPTEEERHRQQLRAGASQRAVQIEILDTPEYFNAPPPAPVGTAQRR